MAEGTCQCGCGKPTTIANQTDSRWGNVKGKHLRFVKGHRTELFEPNKVTHFGDGVSVLSLERRDGTSILCRIDTVDYPLIAGHRWHAQKNGSGNFYAVTTVVNPTGKPRQSAILMHCLLLPDASVVDHEDRNGMNNRRSNLRTATYSLNMANSRKPKIGITSRFKGVSRHRTGKFRAGIGVNHKRHYLGLFVSEEEAALAYNAAALHYFGEFARLNDVYMTELRKAA